MTKKQRFGLALGAAVAAATAGCATPTSTGHPPVTTAADRVAAGAEQSKARKLLAVADFDGADFAGSVETFPLRGNGNIPPTTALTGSQTGINNPSTVGIDGSGRVYVLTGSYSTPTLVSVFAPGATGNVPPERTFQDAASGHFPLYLTAGLDGTVYILFSGTSGPLGIDVFPPGANGPTQPIRTITGSKTLLGTSTVEQFLVDAHGGTWWQSDGEVGTNQIVGYAPGANGNVAPARQISGSRAFPSLVNSFAIDPGGHVYAQGDAVYVFGPKQNGNVKAQRTLQPDICDCYLRMYNGGLLYYVAISYKGQAGVIAFDAKASGVVAPTLNMTGPKTLLTQPSDLAGQ